MERPGFYQRYAAIIKMATLGVLILLLLIPQAMIQDVIRERERNQDNVKLEIGSKWGLQQQIAGPIVTIPYYTYKKEGKETHHLHLLPNELKMSGDLDTSLLKRSIYKVIAYETDLQITGNFDTREIENLGISKSNIDWGKAVVTMGISDLTGIQDRIILKWDTRSIDMNPGIEIKDNYRSGVSAQVVVTQDSIIPFSVRLSIKGSDRISFAPIGKTTDVQLTSKCPNPSFDGQFIPVDRDVSNKGFFGHWRVFHLNRAFPQAWTDRSYDLDDTWFGVSLMMGVDHYLKSMRSAKYAILFIAMTFITFFFIEMLNKKKIHPIQYILIGLVLVIFYILLLSLSEQSAIGFDLAYLIASVAVVSLITMYASSVLGSKQKAFLIFGVLTVLYAFIYVILQMAEQSLLVGSIGLFLFLAAVMMVSRNVDWYNIGLKENDNGDQGSNEG